MIRIMNTACVLILLSAFQATDAQQPDFPKPAAEHEWLKKFEGEWTTESKATMIPGQPEMQCKGTVSCRMLGGFWVVNEWNGDMNGVEFKGLQTLGFDPAKKKYVGTWVDGMTSHMWKYEGQVEDNRRIVLQAKGPNFMAEGKETDFRDIYEFKSDTEMIVKSEMLGEDGKWITFMHGTSTRRPSK
jgi:hypothetical protein